MAGRIQGHGGGTLGLLDLLEEHWEAIDYDLLQLGLDLNDLGSDRLDWRRLRAVVTNLPATSALARSIHGDDVAWGPVEHLLAAAVDALHNANWQRSGKKGNRPKPVQRPTADETRNGRTFGTASLSIAEADAFFDALNRPSPAPP